METVTKEESPRGIHSAEAPTYPVRILLIGHAPDRDSCPGYSGPGFAPDPDSDPGRAAGPDTGRADSCRGAAARPAAAAPASRHAAGAACPRRGTDPARARDCCAPGRSE